MQLFSTVPNINYNSACCLYGASSVHVSISPVVAEVGETQESERLSSSKRATRRSRQMSHAGKYYVVHIEPACKSLAPGSSLA
ncbi:hypothetical protein HBI04_060570 [Parastagonospora nodorum]|nr:hypothetical protein HBI03_052910 [Parastagonospora nodorum]KAH4280428.1 hypothetical protein HBI04_060570 [Parastagonospora nodorum]KAH5292056.1 hypothetical protein HBI11_192990 [Parastagonospora nodorum]KAH5346415.1 hypothetical protein HBI48_193070 [Parastagonospora nodorum]